MTNALLDDPGMARVMYVFNSQPNNILLFNFGHGCACLTSS